MTTEFDPFVELHGLWTLELVDRYLPIVGMPPAKYECVDGYLVMSLRGYSSASWAAGRMTALMHDFAPAAGFVPYLRFTVAFDPTSWIEPDLVVLRSHATRDDRVLPEEILMPIEFVCPPRVDRIDRRSMCAAAGIPYFMTVTIGRHEVRVDLLRLDDSGDYVVLAKALSGQDFRTDLPFPLSFDPFELMEP